MMAGKELSLKRKPLERVLISVAFRAAVRDRG